MEMGHSLMPRGPQILFMIGIYMYLPSNFRDIYYFDPFNLKRSKDTTKKNTA
jgi:hypothetical protein